MIPSFAFHEKESSRVRQARLPAQWIKRRFLRRSARKDPLVLGRSFGVDEQRRKWLIAEKAKENIWKEGMKITGVEVPSFEQVIDGQMHHPTRKGSGYFGAVPIRDGKFIYCREEERFNGATFFSFLKKSGRARCHTGHHVVLILDNIKYHVKLHFNWRKKSQEHLTSEFTPPYSPELSSTERVWLTRRMGTHNRYFPTLTAVISSVENVFNHWQHQKLCFTKVVRNIVCGRV